jgi:hypothetical protein
MSSSRGQRGGSLSNHYYYHNNGGSRYWSYFDRGGLNWYGFYFGSQFCWFPYYGGYWWWYDTNLARWDYWSGGNWWWNGPGGAPYVYDNDDYVPYGQYQQQAAVSGQNSPAPPTTPPTAPQSVRAAGIPAKEGGVLKSPDGKRLVQIVGSDAGAFLFNESSSPPVFMKFLGENAEKVRFSGGKTGTSSQILVDYADGTFALFDGDGNSMVRPSAQAAAPAQGR